MKAFCVISLILILAAASFAQVKRESRGERLITALINSKTLPPIWGDDGFRASSGSPELIRIFRLGGRAVPLLIKHLDDRRVFVNMVRRDQGDQTLVPSGKEP